MAMTEWEHRIGRLPTHVAVAELAAAIEMLGAKVTALEELVERGRKDGRLPPLPPEKDGPTS